MCQCTSSLMKTHCRCKGKQSAPSELLPTPTSTPPPAPPLLSASSYSSTSSPLPPCSYMLLSAQDEASGHVGISPDGGSRLNVGEDAGRRASKRLFQRQQTEAGQETKSPPICAASRIEEALLRFPRRRSCSKFAERVTNGDFCCFR